MYLSETLVPCKRIISSVVYITMQFMTDDDDENDLFRKVYKGNVYGKKRIRGTPYYKWNDGVG